MCQSLYAIWYAQECCWDNEYAQKSVRSCHWLETAAMVAAAGLFILSAFAFSQTGTFTNSPAAVPFGLFCLATTSAILLVELIYKAIIGCRAWLEAESSFQQNLSVLGMPRQSLKVRLKKQTSGTLSATHDSSLYSPRKNIADKLALLMDRALRSGLEKKYPYSLEINLEASVDQFILATPNWFGGAEYSPKNNLKGAYFSGDESGFKMVGVYEHREQKAALSFLQTNLKKLLEGKFSSLEKFDDKAICDALMKVQTDLASKNEIFSSSPFPTYMVLFEDKIFFANCCDSYVCYVRDHIFQVTEVKEGTSRKRVSARLSLAFDSSKDLNFEESGEHKFSSPPPMLKITAIYKGVEENITKGVLSYQAGEYLVCASRGFWEKVCNDDVLSAMKIMQKKQLGPAKMAAHLLELATRDHPDKNMTVLVVRL